jgi:integrase
MGLPVGKGLHQLRHFYASLLIAAGRSPKEVQERLGHATTRGDAATYVHLWHSADEGTRDGGRRGVRGAG